MFPPTTKHKQTTQNIQTTLKEATRSQEPQRLFRSLNDTPITPRKNHLQENNSVYKNKTNTKTHNNNTPQPQPQPQPLDKDMLRYSTATAPVNIATLKYWGKRDIPLNLPTNSSISITLSMDDLRTKTTVVVNTAANAEGQEEDQLIINNEKQQISHRTKICLSQLRALRTEIEYQDNKATKLAKSPLLIVSENNFPTAAGLASSAAGFAAMVTAVNDLYQLNLNMGELSKMARLGSGSACRSLFGGFVAWEMGNRMDGDDSKAVQILSETQWDDIKALILVVNEAKKDTPSTVGMQITCNTSTLFRYRVDTVVPKRFIEMKETILNKDFHEFAELTMMDSNNFHATCMDSFPPIYYMNDTSKRIIKLCHMINEFAGTNIVAYTFDAGPNAVLYYQAKDEKTLFSIFNPILHNINGWNDNNNMSNILDTEIEGNFKSQGNAIDLSIGTGVTRVIKTKIGKGPQICDDHLIDTITGTPL